MEHILYFVGLTVLAVSVGSYTNTPEYGFMVLGGGLVFWPVCTQLISPIIRRLTR